MTIPRKMNFFLSFKRDARLTDLLMNPLKYQVTFARSAMPCSLSLSLSVCIYLFVKIGLHRTLQVLSRVFLGRFLKLISHLKLISCYSLDPLHGGKLFFSHLHRLELLFLQTDSIDWPNNSMGSTSTLIFKAAHS